MFKKMGKWLLKTVITEILEELEKKQEPKQK